MTKLDYAWKGGSRSLALKIAKQLESETYYQQVDLSHNYNFGDQNIKVILKSLAQSHQLIFLNLFDTNIGVGSAEDLAYLLKNSKTLTDLNLSNNQLNSEAIALLALGLSENISLKRLNLSINFLRSEGFATLIKATSSHLNLTELNVANNHIGLLSEEHVAPLADNTSLQYLNLKKNMIAESARVLWQVLGSNSALKQLNLSNNNIPATTNIALAECLSTNQSLDSLDLSENPIGRKDVEPFASALGNNTTLHALWMDKCSLTDDSFLALMLRGTQHISTLSINNNAITAEVFLKLNRFDCVWKDLMALHLGGNPLGERGLASLVDLFKRMPNLTTLDLHECSLNPVSILPLFTALKDNCLALTHINLSGNNLGDKGAEIIADYLATDPPCRELLLDDNDLSGQATARIAQACKTNHHLIKIANTDLKQRKLEAYQNLKKILENNKEAFELEQLEKEIADLQ